MIRIENVTKFLGKNKVLDNLTLTVPKGSVYGLMGLNGAGKTTIIKHLSGYLVQDEGDITIDGESVLDNESMKQKVAVIPDELYFFKSYNLKEMGKYYSRIYHNWNQQRFESMIDDFGLDPKVSLGKFSKGMRKQASFCLALSIVPEYLILDEPVDGLDPIVRHKLWQYIMADIADREMTVLVSSHNAKEMENVCNYVGIMSHGKIVFEGDLLETEDANLEQLFIDVLGGEKNE